MECAALYLDKKHYFPLHLHPDRYTFSYVLKGESNLLCNNSLLVLKAGDLVVIPPYVAHQTFVENFFHYKVIRVPILHSFNMISTNQLGVTIVKNCYSYKYHFNNWYDSIKADKNNNLISTTNKLDETKVPKIFRRFLMTNNTSLTQPKIIFKKVLIHLENNYNRPILVEELSDLAHLSESHFQRLFKLNIGISASRYLQNLRIEKAKEYIKTRDRFTSIAFDTGFFDQSHFNRYFKINVGMNPKRYADLVKND